MERAISDQGTPVAPNAVAVEDRRSADVVNTVGRVAAMVAAAVPVILGLIALSKFDWSRLGFDAPAVVVADIAFRPWVAMATVVLGLFALGAAVSWDRESKLFMGAILAAIGIAILIAKPTVEAVVLNNRMAWMAIIVGAVLAAVGILTGQTWSSRRVRSHPTYV
jgi:hypothetical protein